MKLLHLDSAITGDASISRRLTADIVSRLKAGNPTLDITSRDLATHPLDHFALAAAPSPDDPDSALAEFLAADVVVIGAPMYNFAVPSQLKAWIDRILVAGSTFRYGETGAIGLVGDKRVIVAIARGNRYAGDAPAAHQEHAETLLRTIFGFIGITPEFVIAEGMLLGPDAKEMAMTQARSSIDALAA